MKGMLAKDLVIWRKLMPGYVFLLIIYAATTVIGTVDWMMFIVPVNIFFTLSSTLTDVAGGWSKTVVCFPMDRKNIVTSRYISAVITAGVSVLMILLSGTISAVFFGMEAVEMLYAAGFAVIYCFFFAALSLFLKYMFKTDNGKALGWLVDYIAFLGGMFAAAGKFFTDLRANMSLAALMGTSKNLLKSKWKGDIIKV